MSETDPALTQWLSILLGLYLLAGGIGAMVRGDLWPEMIADFERSPALLAITGAVAFAIGAVIVSIHNVWNNPNAVIVSLAGWIAVVEGLVLLAFPSVWLRLARALMNTARFWGVFMLVVGAFLLSTGLVGWLIGPLGFNL